MKKPPIPVAAMICLLHCLAIFVIAQQGVPVEQEKMHRLKFQNEFVRFFDVLVPVGKASDYHIHKFDGIGIRLSDARIVDETPDGEKEADEVKMGMVLFATISSPITHRVINDGATDFRNIFIELLTRKPSGTNKTYPILSDGHVIEIENERVRVSRLVLKPGESSKLHTHQLHGLGVTLYDSKIEIRSPGQAVRKLKTKAGDFVWQNAGTAHTIKNVGATVFEAIDIELK